MKKFLSLLSAVAVALLGNVAIAATVDDVLTASLLAAPSTDYTDFSNVQVTSAAVYAGNSAKSSAQAIQLRSKNSNSGIVTTASGGKARKVVVTWDSGTTNGRKLDIYGKSTAYSNAKELYNAGTQGTKIGTITYGTSTEFEITDDYEFIGVRSNSGAMYLTNITITWEQQEASAVANPVISVEQAAPYFVGDELNVSISCETEGAEIYYTLDGTEPTAETGIKCEGTEVIVATKEAGEVTLKAVALLGTDASKVVSKTFTFNHSVASVAEFNALAEGDLVRLNFPLTVLYAAKSNVFAQDEAGDGIWLYAYASAFTAEDAAAYTNGSVIPAGVIGKFSLYNDNIELAFGDYASQFKALGVTAGEPVGAEAITIEQLETGNYLNKLVAIENVTMSADGSNAKLFYADQTTYVYNNFGIEMPADFTDKTFDITALAIIYNSFYSLYPVSVVEHTTVGVAASRIDGGVSIKVAEGAVMVNGADGKVVVFDAMGRVVKSVSANGEATVEMPAGYYIVRTAGVAKAVIVK